MDSYTNIDLKELLASAALEDEELAEKLNKEGAGKLTFQKIEWKADEEAGGFERELVGVYVQKNPSVPALSISNNQIIYSTQGGKMKLNEVEKRCKMCWCVLSEPFNSPRCASCDKLKFINTPEARVLQKKMVWSPQT